QALASKREANGICRSGCQFCAVGLEYVQLFMTRIITLNSSLSVWRGVLLFLRRLITRFIGFVFFYAATYVEYAKSKFALILYLFRKQLILFQHGKPSKS
ncbi:MAG: hypothetical protein LBH86_03745, partial [Oscillospiraceae bacterium]|nr:hypothetical protein [Oscillospiraceae bacterium]